MADSPIVIPDSVEIPGLSPNTSAQAIPNAPIKVPDSAELPSVAPAFDAPHQQPGFIQGFVQDALHPITRELAAVNRVALATRNMFGGHLTDKEKESLATDQYDMGYLGTVTPPNGLLDSIGTGMQTAAYFVGGGEAKGAEGAIEAGAQATKTTFFKNLLKTATPFALLQGVGSGASDLGEGKSATQSAVDTTGTILGTYAGFGILHGMGNLLKMGSGALMKSDVVKAANQSLLDFAGHVLSLDGKFAQDAGSISSKDAALQTKALQQSYTGVHKQAMDAAAEALKQPTTWDDVYRGITGKVANFYDTAVKQKDAIYSKVFTPDFFPSTLAKPGEYATKLFDALDTAKAKLGISSFPESKIALGDFKTPAEALKNAGLTTGQNADSPLAKYVSLVENTIGSRENPKPLSMKDFDVLHTSAPLSNDPIEDKHIKDISTSLYQAAKDELAKSADSRAPETLKAWDEARTQWQNLRSIANTKFFSDMKNVGDAKAFVQNIMNSKPGVFTQKIIDGLDPNTKTSISNVVYNMALDLSRSANADYAKGGKALTEMLDRWSPTGLITPQHELALRSFADGMKGTYDDLVGQIAHLSGSESATQALGDATTAQGKAELAKTVEKAMNGGPLYKVNEDGTFDLKGLSSVVKAINKDGSFDALDKQLTQTKNFNLSEVSGGKMLGIMQSLMGASLAANGHPMIGAGVAGRGLEKVFGKGVTKVSSDDLAKVTSKLITEGTLSPSNTSKVLSNILLGQYDKAVTLMAKVTSAAGTEQGREINDLIEANQ